MLLVALILILAIAYGFLPKPVAVETAKVMAGYMSVTVEEEGKTRVTDRFIISAPVSGYAQRVEYNVGDRVIRDQVLTTLEPLRPPVLDMRSHAEAEARVAASEAALRSAEENTKAAAARAELAEKELQRVRQLIADELTTEERLDAAETESRLAAAALHSAKFAVDVAYYNREAALTALKYSGPGEQSTPRGKVVITAPISGSILKILHESEGAVREGQALLELGDPGALEVEVDVLSSDAVRMQPGTRVLFDRWGGPEALEGKVRVVEPAGFTKISALGVEEQRVLVIADILSPPELWPQLGDGYRVEASFILWEDDDVLQVPSSALFRHDRGWAAFVVNGSRADLRSLEIGRRSGLTAQILTGLSSGEEVIVHPDSAIEDGTAVQRRGRGTD
jgi:HlyD family secretion protein